MTEKATLWNRFIEEDWEETDNAYYDFEPSLCDCLEEFVWENKNVIFD